MKLLGILLFLCSFEVLGLELKNSSVRELSPGRYELLEYVQSRPPEFHLPAGARWKQCRFMGKVCQGQVISFHVPEGLVLSHQKRFFEASYLVNGKVEKFVIELFSSPSPESVSVGKSGLSHPLIFALIPKTNLNQAGSFLFILSGNARVTFFRRLSEIGSDFRPHVFDGKVWYSYYLMKEGIENVGGSGPRVILDDNFQVVRQIDLDLDGHEFLLLGPDHWMGIEIELDRLKNGQSYLNKIIRERKNGKILFEYSVKDYLKEMKSELTSSIVLTSFRGEVVAEILHINSLQILKDDKLLVGMAYNGVGLLDKKSRKMDWQLAGLYDDFQLPITQNPLFEHSAVLNDDGELCLFSNLTPSRSGLVTKVFCLKLDQEKRRVTNFRMIRDQNEITFMMGGMQIIEKRPNIFFGLKKVAPFDFVEMFEGKDVWKLRFGEDWVAYRFYRAPQGEYGY